MQGTSHLHRAPMGLSDGLDIIETETEPRLRTAAISPVQPLPYPAYLVLGYAETIIAGIDPQTFTIRVGADQDRPDQQPVQLLSFACNSPDLDDATTIERSRNNVQNNQEIAVSDTFPGLRFIGCQTHQVLERQTMPPMLVYHDNMTAASNQPDEQQTIRFLFSFSGPTADSGNLFLLQVRIEYHVRFGQFAILQINPYEPEKSQKNHPAPSQNKRTNDSSRRQRERAKELPFTKNIAHASDGMDQLRFEIFIDPVAHSTD